MGPPITSPLFTDTDLAFIFPKKVLLPEKTIVKCSDQESLSEEV